MTKAAPLRLDGYCRVSKVGGRNGEGFISPDVQAEAIRAWAGERHTLTLHEPELDRSGGTMDRPVFSRIMQRIRDGESDGLVVYRVDRFARSLLGALTTLEEIADAGGTFASVSDNVDLTTAQGRAFLHMQLVFAQLFREQVREGFATATARAVHRGVHICNSVPIGYDRVDQRLVLNADAPIVHELFVRRAEGQGFSALAAFMDGAAPRPDGGRWTPARMRALIAMRTYRGEAHHGANVNPDAHAPIVSEAEFRAASMVRALAPPRAPSGSLLAGLIRCASCRYMMAPSSAGKDGATLTYRCRVKHTTGRCPAPVVIARGLIEAHVIAEARRGLTEGHDRLQGARLSAQFEAAAARVSELEAEMDAFASDTTARRLLGDERYHAAMRQRAEAITQATAERDALGHAGEPGHAIPSDVLDDFDRDEWRDVLARTVEAVFIRPPSKRRAKQPASSRTHIAWRGDGPADLPRRGQGNGPIRPFVWPDDAPVSSGMAPGKREA